MTIQEDINKQFEAVKDALKKISEKTRPLMPLVADSVDFTIKVLDTYKQAYLSGFEKNAKKRQPKK